MFVIVSHSNLYRPQFIYSFEACRSDSLPKLFTTGIREHRWKNFDFHLHNKAITPEQIGN